MPIDLGQYRLNTINDAKAELAKPKDTQSEHRRLFVASTLYRLEGVITDMLEKPVYNSSYTSPLYQFIGAYSKIRQIYDNDNN